MKKVLIVSPHFAPVNAPDMQRVRLALPYLRRHGWEPVVLALAPECIEGAVLDPLLEKTYPDDIRVIRVRGLSPSTTRRFGFGGLWLRCGRAMRAAGEQLLTTEKFDLVFFSTTQFDAFALGPVWMRKFGVPYVLDYQDPWRNNYYRRSRTRPPGGHLKFALAQWRARRQEPLALRHAGGVIAVSDAYGRTLSTDYPWFDAARVQLLPFGAASADMETARRHRPAAPLIDFNDGYFHHVYTGRCGPDMSISLTTIFRAFKLFLVEHPAEAERVRFHFIGTDYAPPPLGRDWVAPIAQAEGIAKYVSEHRYRVSYFDALHYLAHCHALVAVGSNDPTYSASKIFPCILAARPMLVVFNTHSPVLAFAEQTDSGIRFSFSHKQDIPAVADAIYTRWFMRGGMREYRPVKEEAFRPFTAEAMTQKLVDVFSGALT